MNILCQHQRCWVDRLNVWVSQRPERFHCFFGTQLLVNLNRIYFAVAVQIKPMYSYCEGVFAFIFFEGFPPKIGYSQHARFSSDGFVAG